MNLLSFHPFSIFRNGGGARILRRLYEGQEPLITCLIVSEDLLPVTNDGNINEIFVAAQPVVRKWMRWHLRKIFKAIREKALISMTVNRIRENAAKVSYDVLHILDHGPYSCALCNENIRDAKALWVSFHDHFSTTNSSFTITNTLWKKADRRLVISRELGIEYQRLFGNYEFEIITDGIRYNEISTPSTVTSSNVTIYFAGLLHFEYLPLFRTLADSLDQLTDTGLTFTLILRGDIPNVDFLEYRKFKIEYRREFLSDNKALKKEMDLATILYLPIKFSDPSFYLFSLSTKMVGYLGGAGSILYHGPRDSAACNLLYKTKSAVCCTSQKVSELSDAIYSIVSDENNDVSHNAKILARNTFDLDKIKRQFWQE